MSLRDIFYCLKCYFKQQAECNYLISKLGTYLKLTRCKNI